MSHDTNAQTKTLTPLASAVDAADRGSAAQPRHIGRLFHHGLSLPGSQGAGDRA